MFNRNEDALSIRIRNLKKNIAAVSKLRLTAIRKWEGNIKGEYRSLAEASRELWMRATKDYEELLEELEVLEAKKKEVN